MPNYTLYAWLDTADLCSRLRGAIAELESRLEGQLAYKVSADTPHVTVVYGPALEAGHTQALTADGMQAVYPGVQDWAAKAVGSPVAYRGVSHFKSGTGDRVVLCLEWHCSQLNEMRTGLVRTVPTLAEARMEDDAMRGDGRFSVGGPSQRWAHTTLCVLKAGADVLAAAEIARECVQFIDFSDVRVTGVSALSAVTDTHVLISGREPLTM